MTTHLLSFVYSDLALNREIIRYLLPVRVYFPWGINPPEYIDDSEIIISYPPEELSPDVDITLLLDEYYNWAHERGEKNRNEVINTSSGPASDESIRSIRAIISGRAPEGASEKDMAIRWHILLHLRDKFECQRKEANRMIEAIRNRKSPLFNHAELTDKTLYPFEALKGMDEESFVRGSNLRQLLKAWHGLFGGYIEDGDLLLSIDRPVFDYLLNEYERLLSTSGLKTPFVFSFKIPIFPEKETVDYAGDDDTRTLFSEIKSKERLSGVMDVIKGYESRHCIRHNTRHILFTALYMDAGTVKNDPFLRPFSDRKIIHAETIGP